jgi:hypothetical protein
MLAINADVDPRNEPSLKLLNALALWRPGVSREPVLLEKDGTIAFLHLDAMNWRGS